MNPEEGQLRPQIMDRFGLRIIVGGLERSSERLEAYRRVHAYKMNPHETISQYDYETEIARDEIQVARELLGKVKLSDEVAQLGLELVEKLQIASLRAEITVFEAARAHAAADGRIEVTRDDFRQVAPMALRLRRSQFMTQYFADQRDEEAQINSILEEVIVP
jgi:magnesium chelatase subunit I